MDNKVYAFISYKGDTYLITKSIHYENFENLVDNF